MRESPDAGEGDTPVTVTDRLLRRIRLGEDSRLEYKRVGVAGGRVAEPHRNAIADELAAMANGQGGDLVLGVDDKTRDIVGIALEDLDAVESWVRNVCTDLVKPALDADIRKLELAGSQGRLVPVLFVGVPRSLFVHRSPGGYFRRLGSSKRELPPEALARLFQERSQSRTIRFDESVVPGAAPEDLDYALTRRFLRDDAPEQGSDAPGIAGLRKLDVDGIPVIRRECEELSGRLPEYELIDDRELRLVMWATE